MANYGLGRGGRVMFFVLFISKNEVQRWKTNKQTNTVKLILKKYVCALF